MNKSYLLVALLAIFSCKTKKKDYKSPAGYDLTQPEKIIVPESLDEVSGITFYNGNSDTIYAHQDEEGKVYCLRPGDKKARNAKFAKAGDYEDITIINEQVFILRSDGTLFSFPFSALRNKVVEDPKIWEGLLPKGEFEGLCGDPAKNQLFVLCKQCKDDETTKAVTAYILQIQPDGSIVQSGSGVINVDSIKMFTQEKKIKFHPSAFTKHPTTGQFYIVSAVNNLLVITGSDWKVQEVYPIDPSDFRQPEGIAFDKENNLYISNEGDELSRGNVLKFALKKKN